MSSIGPSHDKCNVLRVLFATLLVVVAAVLLIRYLFDTGFLITEKSVVQFLIENEERSLGAAKLLQDKSRNPALKDLAAVYIDRQQDSIKDLEEILDKLQ